MTELRLIELARKHNLISTTIVNNMNGYDNNVLGALIEISKQIKSELLVDKWHVESKSKANLLELIRKLEVANPIESIKLTHEFLKG
ncbi:MAG: hypothetical protein IM600_18605 [Bacteroidetes bacterium]|nr:hypothetical protein [Bacteroidota bacterium]